MGKKQVSVIRILHNYPVQTNPWHRVEEQTAITVTRNQKSNLSKALCSFFSMIVGNKKYGSKINPRSYYLSSKA